MRTRIWSSKCAGLTEEIVVQYLYLVDNALRQMIAKQNALTPHDKC